MVQNKKQTDRIHEQMPKFFKTRQNPNWNALISAIGESDEKIAELIEEVRKQLFIKTANRPYLDKLGSNFNVSRPRFIGMDDPTFRRYIPVIAYQPKQVKIVLDQLLDIFFFKQTTTAFTQSQAASPYALIDGWELTYKIDGIHEENIIFKTNDFMNISAATAEEVASIINRQAQYSFAIAFDDRIKKQKFIRIFSNTIGSKGSVQILGGRADIILQFTGFKDNSGSSTNTQWTVTKIGDTMKFTYVGGNTPNLQNVEAGDIVLISIVGNEGSFIIDNVNLSENSFSFVNLFGTAGSYDHSSLDAEELVRFMTPQKMVVFTNDSRSLVWEVSPGEIIVEMPATPPVVKRFLAGSAHINGIVEPVSDIPSSTSIELEDGSEWPTAGKFVLQPKEEIQTHILTSSEDVTLTKQFNTRFDKNKIYSYTSKTGDILNGITPNLPAISDIFEVGVVSATRNSSQEVTVTTTTPHSFLVGEGVKVYDMAPAISTVGIRVDVLVADTATQVAAKVAAKINDYTDFNATSLSNVVTITNAVNGVTTDAADVDAGVLVSVTQQGTGSLPEITDISVSSATSYDVSGDGERFTLNSANDATEYHVWFKVLDGSNTQTNPGLNDTMNGTFEIIEVPSNTTFKYISGGEEGSEFGGEARVERVGISTSGALAYLTSAQIDSGIFGPYMWSEDAAFVLSSLTSTIQSEIRAGNIVRTLQIAPTNNIPDQEGFAIFDFGTELQEGPVRYLYKPTTASMQMDPAYVFKNNHDIGSSVTIIRRKGAHVISGTGKEYPAYVTDPAIARNTLQNLMLQVKSAGIFIDFLIRYPQQLYSTLDVYRSVNPDLWPINDDEKALLDQ